MKKTLFVLVAAMLVFTTILTGCEVKEKETGDNEAVNSELIAYNESLEAALEEFEPKADLDKEVLATVNGLPVSAAAVRYTSIYEESTKTYYPDMTEEQIKTDIENYYKQNAALVTLAFEKGVELSETDITTIKANITGFKMQYGDEYDAVFADSPYTKFNYFLSYSIYSPLFTNLCNLYIEDTESDIAKTAKEETLAQLTGGDYVRAKHILIQFPAGEGENGELTDAQKQATLDKANEVLAKVNAMGDISEFDALITEYNEDPGMQTYTDGYFFGKGEMVPEFEEAAFALEVGATSELVETSYGYHILLKLPLDDEFVLNSELYGETYNAAVTQKVNDYLIELGNSYEIKYAENHDARVAQFKEEYNTMLAEKEAAAKAAEEAAAAETETTEETAEDAE